MSLSFAPDMDKLNKKGLSNIIRYNKGKFYSVAKVKEDQYLFLLFNQ